jgi:hypothetical protein
VAPAGGGSGSHEPASGSGDRKFAETGLGKQSSDGVSELTNGLVPTLTGPPELVPPEVAEPIRRQCGVPHGAHNAPVPEVGLDGTGVPAVVGELEPAAVAKHVRMDEKAEFGRLTSTSHHAPIASDT